MSKPGLTSARCSLLATGSFMWSSFGLGQRGKRTADMNPFAITRRSFLARYAGCLGSLALVDLLLKDGIARASPATPQPTSPLSPRPPHHTPRAKAVICLFQHGGPSQMDLFDPKPVLAKQQGKPYPGRLETHFHTQVGNLLASPFQFQKHGKAGIELSELLP